MALARRLVARIAPLLLGGCTALSGVTAFEVDEGPNEAAQTAREEEREAGAKPPKLSNEDGGSSTAGEDDAGASSAGADAGADAGGGEAGGAPITVTFNDSLAVDDLKDYGPFVAAPGTKVTARTTGSGDPDLFLRFGGPATFGQSDCVSDSADATEFCQRTVPAGKPDVHVRVYGFESCSYTLTITYTPP